MGGDKEVVPKRWVASMRAESMAIRNWKVVRWLAALAVIFLIVGGVVDHGGGSSAVAWTCYAAGAALGVAMLAFHRVRALFNKHPPTS